jgi:ankyrin repeat protein
MVSNDALHATALEGCPRKVRALVEAGLDVNARRDVDDDTPLYLAAIKSHIATNRLCGWLGIVRHAARSNTGEPVF